MLPNRIGADGFMAQVISRDGTRVAYDRTGEGPAVILVNGALGAPAGFPGDGTSRPGSRRSPRSSTTTCGAGATGSDETDGMSAPGRCSTRSILPVERDPNRPR